MTSGQSQAQPHRLTHGISGFFSLYPGVFFLAQARTFRTADSMEVTRHNQPLLVGFSCGDGITVYPHEMALVKMQADTNGLNSPSVEPLRGNFVLPPNSGKRNYAQ